MEGTSPLETASTSAHRVPNTLIADYGREREREKVYYAFVNVIFNGVLKLAGTVKIQGFDTFLRWKSRSGGYRVRYGRSLKLSGRKHSCVVYIYYVKRYRDSFMNQWEDRIGLKNFKNLD